MFNFFSCENVDFYGKLGVPCDDPDVIKSVEDLLALKKNGSLLVIIRVDKNNIVEWDYKNGRYLCRAKVYGVVLNNATYFKLYLSNYGIELNDNGTIKGWIYYQTFFPTVEEVKIAIGLPAHFWVELIPKNKIPY